MNKMMVVMRQARARGSMSMIGMGHRSCPLMRKRHSQKKSIRHYVKAQSLQVS